MLLQAEVRFHRLSSLGLRTAWAQAPRRPMLCRKALARRKYEVEALCSKEMPTHRMRSEACTSSSIRSNTSSGVMASSACAA